VTTYDGLLTALDEGLVPGVAVHAVEDRDGLVLYDAVNIMNWQIDADLPDILARLDGDVPEEYVLECVAVFACRMAHRSHASR
jgi:hypothetical protein